MKMIGKLVGFSGLLSAVSLAQAASSDVPVLPPRQPAKVTVTAPTQAGARIEFKEKKYDFGKVPAGKEVRHNFEFTNPGSQTLEIKSVRPSCGCTTAGDYARSIPPGGKGVIPVLLRTANFSGPLHKTITVTSTAVNAPLVTLQLEGEAWVPVSVKPPYLYFMATVGATEVQPRSARILNNLDEPLEIVAVKPSSSNFGVELKPLKPGREYELLVTPKGPFKPGSTQGSITLLTDSKEHPELKVNVFLNLQNPVVATPSHLILPAGPLSANMKRYVTIRSTDSRPLKVLSAKTTGLEGVTVELKETLKQKMWRVEVTLPAGFQLARGQTAYLEVKTDHPKYPLFKIQFVQPQRAPTTAFSRPVRTTVAPRSKPPVVAKPTPPVLNSPVPRLAPTPPPPPAPPAPKR